MPHIFGTRNIE